MILRRFLDANDLVPPERAERRARIAAMMMATAKASEVDLPPEQQRQVIDLHACAGVLVTGAQVEHTARWTAWDWARWGTPWLLLGLGCGAIVDVVVRACT